MAGGRARRVCAARRMGAFTAPYPFVAATLEDLEEEAVLEAFRVGLQELAALVAIVEDVAGAQPVEALRGQVGARLEVVVVVLGDGQHLDAVGDEGAHRRDDVVGGKGDVLHARSRRTRKGSATTGSAGSASR